MKAQRFIIGLLAALTASITLTTIKARAASSDIKLVDLGLSVKWADMNIDATKATDYGSYYAWGETSTKDTYTWANYAYCNGTQTTCQDIGSNISGISNYDPAYSMSTKMCLPTTEQWQELISQCTWKAATVSGVKGYNVTGPNGCTIFLPFSGCSYEGSDYDVGSSAYYWTANNEGSDASKAKAAYIKKGTNSKVTTIRRRTGAAIRAVSATAPSGNQYALYNYRNDGDFNAWLNIDIDSITFSRVDTLGIEHDDVVVQEGWTPDSLYRIPLEAIDSIGFRAPAPVFKSGVYHITEDHCPYVIDTDSLSITFNSNIPFSMLPQKGQIVISDVYGKEPFESGFAGRVKKIINNANTVKIECNEASIDDIYDQIICVGRTIAYASNSSQTRSRMFSINNDGTLRVELLPIKIKLQDPDKDSSNMSINLDITPAMSLDYTIVYNVKGVDNRLKIVAKPELNFDIDFKYKSKIFGDKILKMEDSFIPIETTIPGLYAKLKWGGFFDYEGNLAVDGKLSYKAVLNVGYDSSKEDYYGFIFNNDGSGWGDPDVSVSLNGYIFYGPAFQLVACIVSEKWLPSFNITAKPGCKLSGKFEINDDMFTGESVSVYDALKNTKVSCSGELSIEGEAKVFSEKYTLPFTEWKPDWLKLDFYLYPEFTEASLLDISDIQGTEYSPSFLYSEVSRNLFFPCKIGMAVYDLEGNKVREHFNDEYYWFEKDWSNSLPADRVNRVGVNMKNLTSTNIYKVCPLVQVKSGLPLFNEIEQASPITYFQIPLSLRLEQDNLNLGLGEGKEISILDGWGDYRVINMNPDIVSAQILTHELEGGNMVHGVFVEAKTSGRAFVIVQDLRSDEQVTLSVKIEDNPTGLQLSTSTLVLATGQQGTVDITSGSGTYSIEKIEPTGVVTASISENHISIEALTAGSATITVKDNQTQERAKIEVTVNEGKSTIKVEPTKIDFGVVPVGTSKTEHFTVSNVGESSLTFKVSNQHTEIDIPESGKEFTLVAGEDMTFDVIFTPTNPNGGCGSAVRVFSDAENGTQIISIVGQGAPASSLQLSTTTLTLTTGQQSTVEVISGSGSYDAVSNAKDVATVTVDESKLIITGVAPGAATITVKDNQTQEKTKIEVTVSATPPSYLTCPDDHHPHIIDLGLPSGTRWACCNVDDDHSKHSPTNYGSYYAWGEVEEKEYYDWSTYIHCDGDESTCHDLGGDIAGTQYDVAHVKWGDSWVMPSLDQIRELLDNCTYTWTALNGVNGGLFTGSNGGAIFLPATGTSYKEVLKFGDEGIYWSSSAVQYPSILGYADIFSFTSGKVNWGPLFAYFGITVRPVYVDDVDNKSHLQLSTTTLTLTTGQQGTVEVTSGSGSYDAVSNAKDVATVTVEGSKIIITAVSPGPATITVKDNQTQERAKIEVTVSETPPSYLTCPDDHHPHLIDLGLPSGTKWACCNVDDDHSKQSPTNYGGYYAWGEVEEKDYYDWSNYIHCDGDMSTCHDLGSDIAGTQYDVAHMKWGGSWVMPSLDQIKELLDNCPSQGTTVGGISGWSFTGPNGGTIFLPVAGIRFEEGHRFESDGVYWSSSSKENYYTSTLGYADILYFSLGKADWGALFSYLGVTVRPVSR